MKPRKPLHAVPPAAPGAIALSPAEAEGFAALRREEIALANRMNAAAVGVLRARGVPPDAQYEGKRDENGTIVGFVLKARPPGPQP